MMYSRRAGNGHDFRADRRDPGERQLCVGDTLLLRNGLDQVDDGHVMLEGLFLVEAAEAAAHIALREVIDALDGPGQESSAERPAEWKPE